MIDEKFFKQLDEKLGDHSEKLNSKIEKLESRIDAVVAKGGRAGGGNTSSTTFEGELTTEFQKNAAQFQTYKRDKKGFTLEVKAVGDMGSTNLTGTSGTYFVKPDYIPGVSALPYEGYHVRDLLLKGSTGSDSVRYVRDMGGEGGPGMVAQGNTKPKMDRDLQIFDAPVKKIATYFRIPEEMIDDIDYLVSFLSQVGTDEVMFIEDGQILYGDGTGQNLSGFNTLGTAFAAGTSIVESPNNFDVIGAAKKQLRKAKFTGSAFALVSPTDYFDMKWAKDTTGNYLFQSNQGVTPMMIDGITILEHTAVSDGSFFVFNNKAAACVDRKVISVRLYDQDQDNAIKNLVTMVIEKRLALPIYYPGAIIRGTFSTAKTDLTS